ncbi:MAG: radical SAM family heme chaperone HemW [Actinobacteria bacterium]|nr:radical SAM family heme chaperone HemW [Actinomycetota bacterium]
MTFAPPNGDGGAAAPPAEHGPGVYVHIPFCAKRCDYCAFATWTDRSGLAARYLDACAIQASVDLDGLGAPSTVFVGGGTPTLVDPARLASLITSLGAAPGAEVTVECNPDDVTEEMLDMYLAAGVNRLSIGVQSMDPTVLTALGRTHDPANVERTAQIARDAGIEFNVDLIYGAKGETVTSWIATVDAAIALEPSHVSAYALTVEAGTPLASDRSRHPDDDDQAVKYRLVSERLESAGFEWYEISNWAKSGRRCRHNLTYWLGGDYMAVGCAAHGYRSGRRYWHVHTPERFVDAVENGRSPIAGSEQLAGDEARVEALELSLRTGAGVPIDAFAPEDTAGPLAGLVEPVAPVASDWAVGDGPRWVLTRRGRLLETEVAFRLR